ncbi:hypothetical protein DRQ50_00210 [bacterium]|nr:MAG: hypothetical protein DRQ50_00210 [bacterium]RKZ72449.1 MAG: hypothetical protein DRQ48_00120 [Gammaproteobacteria bacterium]
MSEQGMRKAVTKMLKPLNAISVENPVLPGTPDVNYVEGWIELKWIRAWPKGEDTPVRIEHYTPQQRVWALRRRRAGGRCWWLLRCRSEWLLLDGADAALVVNTEGCNKTKLIEVAVKYWPKSIDQKELIECLTREPKNFTLAGDAELKLRRLLLNGTASPSENT